MIILILPLLNLNQVNGDIDIAKGRVRIEKVEWRNNPPGSYAFEIKFEVYFIRNGLDLGGYYTSDASYESFLGSYSWFYTDKFSGDSGNNDDDYDDYYESTTSYFRRGTSSSVDGIRIRIILKYYGWILGGYWYDGYTIIKDWHYIDSNSDYYGYDTDWICDSKVRITYGINILAT